MKISKQKRSSCSKKSKNRLNMIKVKQSIKQIEKSLQKNYKNHKKSQPIIITSLQKHHANQLVTFKDVKGTKDQLFYHTGKQKTDQEHQATIPKYFTHKDDKNSRLHSNSKTKKRVRLFSPRYLFHNQKTLIKKTTSKKSTENSNELTLIEQLKQQNLFYQQKYAESMNKLSKLSKQLHEQRKVHEAEKVLYERKIYQLKYQIFLKQANIDTPPQESQIKKLINGFISTQEEINDYQIQNEQYGQLKLLSNVSESEQ